jgi:hypothetical protein
MKKITATTILILIFGAIQAQTLDYSIDCPKPDSCFLREVSTAAPTAQEPRPQSSVSWRLFRSWADLDAVIELVRKQARDEAAKGMELMKKAETMNLVADKIKAAKDAQTATADKKR